MTINITREEKVREFRNAGASKNYDDAPEKLGMILQCVDEEWCEFAEAAENYDDAILIGDTYEIEEARAQLVKEWADLQYVVSQAAVFFDIPADPAFNRVHNNNMTKVVDGKIRYREDGKILKPEGYEPADMRGL